MIYYNWCISNLNNRVMASCAFSGIKLTAILYPSVKLLEFVMKKSFFSFSVLLVCVDKLVAVLMEANISSMF